MPTRDAGRGIAINSSGGVSFTADAEPDGPSATYDFTFSCEGLISSVPEEIPAGERACLYPYEFSDGTTGLCALGDGRWQGLVAEGVSLAPHETIECRVEMREQAGDAFVSYLVKKDAAWVRLATQAGQRGRHLPKVLQGNLGGLRIAKAKAVVGRGRSSGEAGQCPRMRRDSA